LNLKSTADRENLLKLVDTADVLIHNTRPQKMAKLELGPEHLAARNPRLIYACLHGYSSRGPYGGRPAYDDVIQGASGLAHLMGVQYGEPRYLPTIIADKTTGLIGALTILAAVVRRNQTGVGASLEIPMFESMVAFNLVEHLYGASFEPQLSGANYPRVMTDYRRPFKTSNGYVCLLPYTNAHWEAFFRAAGAVEALEDRRFATLSDRTSNIGELYRIASELAAGRSTEEWLALGEANDIPCSPVLSIQNLLVDDHLVATDFYAHFEDPAMGEVRLPGVPVIIDGERPPISFPPRLGEHTEEVLREVGVGVRRIDGMVDCQPAEI
ncbi:MAG: L-carnitine dehydratase/bile acid-inducible protein, partial [Acidimicrobiales bacterium]|nr:L-carnitine dehydratase/bile acid-inducible protein [Acidimicrobiales bacterium]